MSAKITLDQLKEHTKKDSFYTLIHGKVYDVTKFLDEHPGGDEVIMAEGGRDATEAFEDVGHSDEARNILKDIYVGDLESEPVLRPNMAKKNSMALTSQAGCWVLTDRASGTKSDDPDEIPNASMHEMLVRHPNFFFDNVLVAIQIENTLFNVHKYQLAKSEVFSDMFKMPKPQGHEPEEGSSPEHPIVIKGVAASDFAALLTVLYASYFSTNQPTPEAGLIIPAFRLANMFDFSDLCAFLLPLAEKNLDDVDKIVIARELDIKAWLAPAHIRLCKRGAVLSTEEANKLGVNSVLLIWRMREQYRQSSTMGAISTNDSKLEADVKRWVDDSCPTYH